MKNGFLHKYFLNNSGRCIHKNNNYFDVYERHLARFVESASVLLEIGVGLGGSLQMWKAYLGPHSKIIGLDIKPECKTYKESGIEIFIGSQDDPKIINAIFSKYPEIDIVIDDGSHQMNHMVESFNLIYKRLQPNGIYMVEDIHTCYWDKYKGGLGRSGSFVEFTKHRIDELNAACTKGELPISEFTTSTNSISCYASIIVYERRKQNKKQGMQTVGL